MLECITLAEEISNEIKSAGIENIDLPANQIK